MPVPVKLVNDATFKPLLASTFGTVRGDATLADAKAVMEALTNCQDVFVTHNGTRDEPVHQIGIDRGRQPGAGCRFVLHLAAEHPTLCTRPRIRSSVRAVIGAATAPWRST